MSPRSLRVTFVASLVATVATSVLAQTTESAGLLRDSDGRTLYVFDRDSVGASRCVDGCAAAWPPFMAGDAARASGKLSVLVRDGGGRQWAWNGKPLYYFSGDTQPADTKGDGSGGSWHVVKPDAAAPRASSGSYDPYKY